MEGTMGYFEWIILLFLLAMVNFVFGMLKLKKFLDEHSRISSTGDLSAFKETVRVQMYLALLQLLLLIGMTVVSIIGILTGALSFTQFILVLVLDGVIWFAGKQGKSVESRVQHMPVDDAELKVEFKSVCKTWNFKATPDF
jgi:uncharacterized membrane protein